jgi:hypothetical protein
MKKHYSSVKRILDDRGKDFGISEGYIKYVDQDNLALTLM